AAPPAGRPGTPGGGRRRRRGELPTCMSVSRTDRPATAHRRGPCPSHRSSPVRSPLPLSSWPLRGHDTSLMRRHDVVGGSASTVRPRCDRGGCRPMTRNTFGAPGGTIVVVPSLTLPIEDLRNVTGIVFYEERLL